MVLVNRKKLNQIENTTERQQQQQQQRQLGRFDAVQKRPGASTGQGHPGGWQPSKLRVRFGLGCAAVLDETTRYAPVLSLQARSSSNNSGQIWHTRRRNTKMSQRSPSSRRRTVAPRCFLACHINPSLGMSAPTLRFVRMLASSGWGCVCSVFVHGFVACLFCLVAVVRFERETQNGRRAACCILSSSLMELEPVRRGRATIPHPRELELVQPRSLAVSSQRLKHNRQHSQTRTDGRCVQNQTCQTRNT